MAKSESSKIPKHIPDEWVAIWKEKTLEELMQTALRLEEHIQNLQTEDSRRPMREMHEALEAYIESSISKRDIDLDTFL